MVQMPTGDWEASEKSIAELSIPDYVCDDLPLAVDVSSPHSSDSAVIAYKTGFGGSEAGSLSTDASETSPSGLCSFADKSGKPLTVVVKNTFIDGYFQDDDEDEAEPVCAIRRVMSCPVIKMPSPKANGVAVSLINGLHSPAGSIARDGALVPNFEAAASDFEQSISLMAVRHPEVSVGSVDHDAGECRPCAWFWRPQGCSNGVDCRHCHLCLEDKGKARILAKKHFKNTLKRRQARMGQAEFTAGPHLIGAGCRQL